MREKEIKVKVKMNQGMLYDFLMYHAYHSMSGIFGTLFGLFWIGFGIVKRQSIDSSMLLLYIGMGLLFVFYMPVTLWFRANMQMKSNQSLNIPLNYSFNEEGMTLRQEKESATLSWDHVSKVCKSRKNLFIYTGIRNSSILPLKEIGDQYGELKSLIEKKVAKERRKGI